jgi:hypothetical protein
MGKRILVVASAAVVVMLAGAAAGCSDHSSGASTGSGGAGGLGGSAGGAIVSDCTGAAGGPPATGGAAAGGAAAGGAAGTPAGGANGCSIPSGPAGTWVEIPAPPGQSGFHVTDAFAVAQDDLLFAGNTFDPTGLPPPADARLLRWTGGCWTVDLSLAPGMTAPDRPSVHGTGPGDLWATASDVLYHRDANGWTRFPDESWRNTVHRIPSSQTTLEPIEFYRVRAAGPDDIWIAATSNILHLSHEAWTTYNFDDPGYPDTSAAVGYFFADIWIDSPTSVWVAGASHQVGNTMSPGIVNHFDGASWTHIPTAVGGVDAIWRGGAVLWLAQPSEDALTLRAFDGTTTTPVPIAGVDVTQHPVSLTNLFGRGANDLWAAGEDVAHFDGQGWSLVTDAPGPAHSTTRLETNTFVTGDAAATWLVTPGPRFFRKVTSP